MKFFIAGFQHETNTFAPSKADWAAFNAGSSFPPYRRGAARRGHRRDLCGARAHSDRIHHAIDEFPAALAKTPRSLKPDARRQLMKGLRKTGYLNTRRVAEIAAAYLGVARATVYSDSKN